MYRRVFSAQGLLIFTRLTSDAFASHCTVEGCLFSGKLWRQLISEQLPDTERQALILDLNVRTEGKPGHLLIAFMRVCLWASRRCCSSSRSLGRYASASLSLFSPSLCPGSFKTACCGRRRRPGIVIDCRWVWETFILGSLTEESWPELKFSP